MDNILNEKTLCRILQGRLRCSLGDPALYIYEPNKEILEESFDVYDQAYKDAYFKGVYLKDELVPILVENDLWTPFDDREADKIEKQIEDHKVKAFEFYYKTRDLANIKMVLRALEKELLKYKSKKHTLDHISCEGVASFARSIWIISKTVYNVDKTPYDWSRHSISSLMDYYNSNQISSDQFRLVARSEPWRSMWNIGKKQGNAFGKSACELSKDQISLSSYSSMYDNVYESSEAPDEKVIEDDDCLDGWFISQRRQYDRQKKKKQSEDLIKNPKIANSQEIFLVAKDQEEASRIYDINDPMVRSIIQDRQNTIKSSDKQIRFQEFNDIKQDIAMDRVQAARSKIKGMR
tara:strand:- start:1192 stop:2241 length:1050 start_codon:yes stop_codon:yes gene_type:complete